MKKKTKKYYRRITESLPQRPELKPFLLSYFTFFMAIMGLVLMVYSFYLLIQYNETADRKLQAVDNLKYWESVVSKHPNFTEGYYNAGFYAYALGEERKAIDYLDQALKLDPDFREAQELAKQIRR